MQEQVEQVVDDVRAFVSADGADIQIVQFDDAANHLRLRLDLTGVECLECVIPPTMLAAMITDRVHRTLSGDLVVEIDDPRETLEH